MSQHNVGIGEYAVSGNQEDVLKTYALGSCVAVLLYDRVKRIGGLIHIALPDSSIDGQKAQRKPAYFADTGLPLILKEIQKRGALRNSLWIKIAGGANIMDQNRHFDIGKRNLLAVKKYLWKNSLGAIKEDVGGDISRTVSLSLATGEVHVSSGKNKWNL